MPVYNCFFIFKISIRFKKKKRKKPAHDTKCTGVVNESKLPEQIQLIEIFIFI